MRLTKGLLSELKQYKGLNLKASDLVKITKKNSRLRGHNECDKLG